MACYQTCVDIGNRCKFTPRYKSCGGCGTICACTVQRPITACCCCRPKVYCNPCDNIGKLTSAQKTPPPQGSSSPTKESKSPVPTDFAKPKPKEGAVSGTSGEPSKKEEPEQSKVLSWLDWILSWFGITRRHCKCKTYTDSGAVQDLSDESKQTEGDKDRPQDKKLGPRSASFCKESSQTSLAKARDICAKVKQLHEADTKRIEEKCKEKISKFEGDDKPSEKKVAASDSKQKGKGDKATVRSVSPVLDRGRKKRRSPSVQRGRSTSRSKRSASSSRDSRKRDRSVSQTSRDSRKRNRSVSQTSRSPSFNSTGKRSRKRSRSRSCGRFRRSSQSPDISPPKLIKSASMTTPCSSFMCRNLCSRPCFPSCYVPRRPLSASCCSSELCDPCFSCRPRNKSPKTGSSSARRSRSCPRPCPCPCLACDPTDPCPPFSCLPCCKPVCKPCPPSCFLPCCKPLCPPPSRSKPRFRPCPPVSQKTCCKQCSMPVSCFPCDPCPPSCCKPCCKPLCPPECCKPCCSTLKSCPPSCVRSCCLPCPRRGPSVYCGPPCLRPCPPPLRRKYPTPACFTSTACSLFPRPCSCPPSPVCPLTSSCGTTMTSLCKSRSNDARCRMLLSKYGTNFPSVGTGGGYKASIPGNSATPPTKAGIEPCENYTHSRRPASPSDMESRDISFNTSPCCKKSRIEFNLAKQHPYIRQMGPRSPCEEFMASLKLKYKKNEKCGDKVEKNPKLDREVECCEHMSNASSGQGATRHSKTERRRSSLKQGVKSLSKETPVAEKDTKVESETQENKSETQVNKSETQENKSENNALSQMRLRYQFNQSACNKRIRCSFGPCSTYPKEAVKKCPLTHHQEGGEKTGFETTKKKVKPTPAGDMKPPHSGDVKPSHESKRNPSPVPFAFKEIEEVLHSSSCSDMPVYNNYEYISLLNKFQEKMRPSQRTELIVESIRQTLRMNKYLHKLSAQSTNQMLKSVEEMCAAAERTFEKYNKEKKARSEKGRAHESSEPCKDKDKASREKARPNTSETPGPKSDCLKGKHKPTAPHHDSGHSVAKHEKRGEDKSANRSMTVESAIFNAVCMQEKSYLDQESNCVRKTLITDNPVGYLNELELSLSAGETKKEFPETSSTILCSDSSSLSSSEPTCVPSTTTNSLMSHYCQDELDLVTLRIDCCESRKVVHYPKIPDSDTTLVQEASADTLLELRSASSPIRDENEFKTDSSHGSLANTVNEVSEAESSEEGQSVSNAVQSEKEEPREDNPVPAITIDDLLGRSQLQWRRMGTESDADRVRDAKIFFDYRRSLVTTVKKDTRPISRIIRSFGVSPATTRVSQSVSQLKAFIQQNGTPV